jgi:hypothetical protein
MNQKRFQTAASESGSLVDGKFRKNWRQKPVVLPAKALMQVMVAGNVETVDAMLTFGRDGERR